MNIQTENLKTLVQGRELSLPQRAQAKEELDSLLSALSLLDRQKTNTLNYIKSKIQEETTKKLDKTINYNKVKMLSKVVNVLNNGS